MFRITQDPLSGSIDSYLIKKHAMVQQCLFCALSVFAGIFRTCGMCARCVAVHTTVTVETLRVVLIKYELILPDPA
jgi:hypothetical protein